MTRCLRAHAFVTPNASHHVKIVIADAVDKSLEAALFIKRGSLRTISPQP